VLAGLVPSEEHTRWLAPRFVIEAAECDGRNVSLCVIRGPVAKMVQQVKQPKEFTKRQLYAMLAEAVREYGLTGSPKTTGFQHEDPNVRVGFFRTSARVSVMSA
jgi:hypothetical protein